MKVAPYYCCIPHRKKSIINDISSVVYNYQSVNKYPSRTTQDHQQSVPKAVVVAQNKSNLTENTLSQTGKNLKPRKCVDRDLSRRGSDHLGKKADCKSCMSP